MLEKATNIQLQNDGENALAARPSGQGVYSPVAGVTLHDHDFRVPFVSVSQPTSQDKGKPGTFYRKDTEQSFATLNVILLAVHAEAIYYGPGSFSRDRLPLCVSHDGVRAALALSDGTPTAYPGQPCRSCVKHTALPWRDTGPEWCSAGSLLMFLDVDTLDTFLFRASGVNAALAQSLGRAGIVRVALIELSLSKEQNTKGTYYKVKARVTGKAEDYMQEIAVQMYGALADMTAVATQSTADEAQGQQSNETTQERQAREFERLNDDRQETQTIQKEDVADAGALIDRAKNRLREEIKSGWSGVVRGAAELKYGGSGEAYCRFEVELDKPAMAAMPGETRARQVFKLPVIFYADSAIDASMKISDGVAVKVSGYWKEYKDKATGKATFLFVGTSLTASALAPAAPVVASAPAAAAPVVAEMPW